MGWFWATDCAAATFAWRGGIGSGLYAIVVVSILIATAPAYDPRVKRTHSDKTRKLVQWMLYFAPAALLLFWIVGAYCFGWLQIGCYVRNLSFGMLLTLAPLVLLFIFTSAQWVGRASAR